MHKLFCFKSLNVVFIHDLLGNIFYGNFYVSLLLHGAVQVEIVNIACSVTCTLVGIGDDAVDHDFCI